MQNIIKMNNKLNYTVLLLAFALTNRICLIAASKTNLVTCGSLIKLLSVERGFRLHSHDVKYGSGSGQQSVTGVELKEDVNSHWVVKSDTDNLCERGEPIKCGSLIRLEHLTTKKNLHSHHFPSPLTGEQEVSAYGSEGVGDTGDHWELICSQQHWLRDDHVRFRHVDTEAYLSMSARSFGRPISGQMEIIAQHSADRSTLWTTAEGLYIMPKIKDHAAFSHSEL